jgi:molybdopterin converting factor small subunit
LHVTVLLFAQARDRAHTDRFTIDLPEGARVTDAMAVIKAEYPALDELWPHLAIAADGVLVPGNATLHEGAELALLPPVSGG